MDEVTKAALAGLVMVAADAAKETTSTLAAAAWGKIKKAFGWTVDPPSAEMEAKATAALEAEPALAEAVQSIVNDYRQQVGSDNRRQTGGVSTRDINAKNALTGNNTFSGPTTFN